MAASTTIVEGKTRLYVPTVSLRTAEPPTAPVFFNPAASINRDISVAVTEATNGDTFLDSLAGVGARGVRVAKEVNREVQVTLLDFNESSLRFARQNVRLNYLGGRCKVVKGEANTYLHSRFGRDQKFDYVDVDPFGSPVPYLQGAIKATADGGIISLTATDTAVLCGVYPGVSRRRYGIAPMNNLFRHETGLRILLNSCRRAAASLDIGIRPVLAHSTRHYMRVYARVEVGASSADATMSNEGYVTECRKCNHISAAGVAAGSCEKCGGRVRVAGPLWVGSLVDEAVTKQAAERCAAAGLKKAAAVLESMEGISGLPPYGYGIELICSALGIPSVSDLSVVRKLEERGYVCRRQPFEKTGLKCNADYEQVVDAVRDVAGTPIRKGVVGRG